MGEALNSPTIESKLQRIADLAKQMAGTPLVTISHHIDVEWLREAYRRIRKDGAVGIDGMTAQEYEVNLESNLKELLARFKRGTYKAPPVRRVYIPKDKPGEMRPLGVPTLEDKILQRAVLMALEAIYEQDFYDCSYGFRPRRSAHDALYELRQALMRNQSGTVLELDIRRCFDSIPHEPLQELLRQRVRDGVIVRTVAKWLNAGVMENGELSYHETGCPQGGVISPLMMNVYLHSILDDWVEKEVRSRLKGRMTLIRFADDAVLVFSHRVDAERVYAVLPKRFERFGLTLHPDKTRLVDFCSPKWRKTGTPEVFSFLGFTFYWGRSRRNFWIVKVKTAKDRLSRAIKRAGQWCRGNRHKKVQDQHRALCSKLIGYYGYFGVTHNSRSLHVFYYAVLRAWQKWLNRRSQKTSMTFARFNQLLQRYPLPRPRIVHSWLPASSEGIV